MLILKFNYFTALSLFCRLTVITFPIVSCPPVHTFIWTIAIYFVIPSGKVLAAKAKCVAVPTALMWRAI